MNERSKCEGYPYSSLLGSVSAGMRGDPYAFPEENDAVWMEKTID